MEQLTKKILIAVLVAAFVAVVVVVYFHITFEFPSDQKLRLKYLELFLNIYKAIGIGFFATLLGTLLPSLLSATKYSFEQLKEARLAYSEAKTSAMYLPYKLADSAFPEGIALIEPNHVKLHLALAYNDELKNILDQFPSPITPHEWGNEISHKLDTMKEVLKQNNERWDYMPRDKRLEAILSTLGKKN